MNATRKLTLALALGLASSHALALGLGQIKVESGLNEPLRAVIPVLVDDPAELRDLTAALASREAFERAGLNFARLRVPLEFEIVKLPDGSTVIKVTTDAAVAEPALGFLLEVNWANGKLLREYSVLLDPPTIAPAVATQRPRSATSISPAAPAPQPSTASASAQEPVTAPPASPTAAAPQPIAAEPVAVEADAETAASMPIGDQYTVQSGDTLWDIATAASANSGVSVNRTMLALQRANPDAFFRDNINALKSGAVMRIPGSDEMAQLQAVDAEVRRQNQVWVAVHAAAPTLVARTGGTDTDAGSIAPVSGNVDHLQLAAPGASGDGGESRAGVEGGSGDQAVAELKQEIARSKEALASEQQRSDELQARVQALEDLKNRNGSLLNLKNAEIAQLQEQLEQARNAAVAAAADNEQIPVATATAAPLRDDIFAAEVPAASVADAAAAASLATGATTGAAESASVAAVAPAASVAATATTGLAHAASTAIEPEVTTTPLATEPAAVPTPTPSGDRSAQRGVSPWYMQTWAWLLGAVVLIAILLGALFSSRRNRARQETLAGAYDERYETGEDQADQDDDEYALIDEIEQHPDDLALRLELASLYYALRDQNKFESAAEAMYAHVDDPQQAEWQQVLAMGEELCPDHPLFADLHADSDREYHAETDSDRDEFETAEDAQPPAAADAERDIRRSSERGYNFDFDLTPGTGASSASAGDNLTPATDEFDAEPYNEPSLRDLAGDDGEGSVDDSGFSNDPVDTKLDLARAYHDMGDAEGARAMLEEVIAEGSQVQQDAARKLLQELD